MTEEQLNALESWIEAVIDDRSTTDIQEALARRRAREAVALAFAHHQADDATVERVARAMFLDGYKGQDVLKEAAWNPHCAEAVARAKAAIAAAMREDG